MAIYTKKGDRGKTSLFAQKTKKKIAKNSAIVETLGAFDELNSFLGVALSFSEDKEIIEFTKEIQKDIFTICSITAGAKLNFGKNKTTRLEKKIDEIDKLLPKLSNFLLSSGTQSATHFMYARSLARRAERRLVTLIEADKSLSRRQSRRISPNIQMYANRLSDMLFMLFRYANFKAGIEETKWKV